MKIAVGSDMKTHLTDVVVEKLRSLGHELELFGALVEPKVMWSKVAVEAAGKVADGSCDQGILFCWTGTGISLAANKVPGIRAALCWDAETARGARQWNDANVLAMSLRATSEAVALEILDAWFGSAPSREEEDLACLRYLERAERELRR